MPAKITKKLALQKFLPSVRSRFSKKAQKTIKEAIVERIKEGKSPVEGEKFQNYSRQYANRKKSGKLSPVTLEDTGKMLRSIKTVKTKAGLSVFFTDAKAKFHDLLGAGINKIKRKMLPSEPGQKFSRTIFKKIREELQSAVKKETRRQNR